MTASLFPLPPADGRLTDRQQTILQMLHHNPAGITALDAGQELHRDCRFCTPERECKYAKTTGLEVLRALKRKGLVRQRKGGLWQPAHGQTDDGPDPATDPFPDGF